MFPDYKDAHALYAQVWLYRTVVSILEDGVAKSVEHWTANLATRVRSPVGEELSDLICALLHIQMGWAFSV